MQKNQLTIKNKTIFEGISLHSGLITRMSLIPAQIDTGIVFIRTDVKKSKPIVANWKNIVSTNLCTKIANKYGHSVSTIEHLMFALYSLGITNLIIEINNVEVPILDGSAKIFVDEILKNGLLIQKKDVKILNILKPVEVQNGNKYIKFEPTKKNFLEINYILHYKDEFIKKQKFILRNVHQNYLEVSNCRTFCHQEDLEKIFSMGLAKGGSLENAIVISGNKILNQGGLRYPDEPVRHKVLDCVGDLYLSGYFLTGKIFCSQGGHEMTAKLLTKIFDNKNNYRIVLDQPIKKIA